MLSDQELNHLLQAAKRTENNKDAHGVKVGRWYSKRGDEGGPGRRTIQERDIELIAACRPGTIRELVREVMQYRLEKGIVAPRERKPIVKPIGKVRRIHEDQKMRA